MNKIIPLLCYLMGLSGAYAQKSYVVSSDNNMINNTITGILDVNTDPNAMDVKFPVYLTNISADSIQFEWERIFLSLPAADWQAYSLCDYQTCYVGIPDTGTMRYVQPQAQGYLIFNVIPNLSGIINLKMHVWDKKYPQIGDTLTWNIHVGNTGINELNNLVHFSVFPNPVSDFVTIEGENGELKEATLVLRNVMGEELIHTKYSSAFSRIDLSAYSNGVYFLSMQTQKGQSTKKIAVNK